MISNNETVYRQMPWARNNNRNLKQWRRRRQGRCQEKNEFIFYIRISQIPRSVQYAYRSQNLLKVDIVMPVFNSKPKYEK